MKGKLAITNIVLGGVAMLAAIVSFAAEAGEIGILFFGIAFLLLGAGMLVLAIQKKAADLVAAIGCGVILMLMGAGTVVTSAGTILFGWNQELSCTVILGGIGMLFAAIAVFDIYKIYRCTQLVQAKCVRIQMYHINKNPDKYAPVYGVTWDGDYFEVETGIRYTKRSIKDFETGEYYPVYLNPKNPRMVRDHRKIRPGLTLFGVIGAFLCVTGMLGLLVG